MCMCSVFNKPDIVFFTYISSSPLSVLTLRVSYDRKYTNGIPPLQSHRAVDTTVNMNHLDCTIVLLPDGPYRPRDEEAPVPFSDRRELFRATSILDLFGANTILV